MSHHHYEDVIDPNKKEYPLIEKKNTKEPEEKVSKEKQIKVLSQQLEKLKRERSKNDKDITDTVRKLFKLCDHKKIKKHEHIVPGGYLNKTQYITTYYCEICGCVVDEEIKYGDYE